MDESQKDMLLLLSKVKDGTASQNDRLQLFRNVEPFVKKTVNKFVPALRTSGETEDLLQEAYIVLQEAAESFDPEGGASFLTWYSFYLHTAFNRFLGSQLGISHNKNDRFRRVRRFEAEYQAKYGVNPPDWLTAEHFRITPATLQKWKIQMNQASSLDTEIAEDMPLLDSIPDPTNLEEMVIQRIIAEDVRRLLNRYLGELDHEEQLAIRSYYFSEKPISMKRCAMWLGISKQELRQRLNRGLRKLRTKKHLVELGKLLPERVGSKPYKNPGSSEWSSSTERTAFYLLRFYNDSDTNKEENQNED